VILFSYSCCSCNYCFKFQLNENQSYFLIDVVIVVGYAAIVVVVAIAQKGVSIFFYLKFFFLLR
jgi:hypothetical protein